MIADERGYTQIADDLRHAMVKTTRVADESTPPEFICPITCDVFKDPVMLGTTGHTFERKAIIHWLKLKKCDPLTNEPLANTMLSPNYSLLEAMQLLDRSTTVAMKRKQDDTQGEQQDDIGDNSLSKKPKI